MARSRTEDVDETANDAFGRLTLDDLRPLAALVAVDPPKRKTELVPLLAGVMTDPARVREFYDGLDELSRQAVRAAAHDSAGRLHGDRFRAQFGSLPQYHSADPKQLGRLRSYADHRHSKPTMLRLFFPRFDHIPSEVRSLLLRFVPPPTAFMVPTVDTPPESVTLYAHSWRENQPAKELVTLPVRVRDTTADAEADVRAVLRLVEAGKVRVTDKKLLPTEATRHALASVLAGGDFYTPDDGHEWKHDPAFDLGIKAFAWPVLVQAGGLAEKSGDALKLTPAGKKALIAPPAEVLRKLWAAWLKTRAFDEFARVETIKGQGRARLSAAAGRRAVVVETLAACPPGRWFAVDDFFRFLRASGRSFSIAYDPWDLYIAEHEYGSLGYDNEYAWEQLQGRFILAFILEYVATLGLIDVAYVPPQDVRHDFRSRWGTDDFSCLSRYDGLLYLRINPLGAWLLGQADEYRPPVPTVAANLKVLGNLDVVAARPLPASEKLLLDRFAEPVSETVWKLSAAKVLGVVEAGGTVDELEQFLTPRASGGLPNTVVSFLADLRRKAGRLTDRGPARLIECADEHLAAELAADRQLKGKCVRAGEKLLVVKEADLDAVRKAVRRLGYVWPVPLV